MNIKSSLGETHWTLLREVPTTHVPNRQCQLCLERASEIFASLETACDASRVAFWDLCPFTNQRLCSLNRMWTASLTIQGRFLPLIQGRVPSSIQSRVFRATPSKQIRVLSLNNPGPRLLTIQDSVFQQFRAASLNKSELRLPYN